MGQGAVEVAITMPILIRREELADLDIITQLTEAAFKRAPHTRHTEQFIVNALRRCGQLTVSLVAVENDSIVGHIAISPVRLSSSAEGWYGLGPISVWPERQGRGIGSMLMNAALAELQDKGAAGCVVLGDPEFYHRFGFRAQPGLELPGVPPEYFQALSFRGTIPRGTVSYHESFEATE